MKRVALLSVVAGLILAGVCALQKSKREFSAAVARPADSVVPSASSLLPASDGYSFREGDHATYDLAYEVKMTDGQTQSHLSLLEGRLRLKALEASTTSTTLACQGEGMVFTTDGQRNAAQEALLNGVTQVLRWNTRGQLLARSFPQGVPAADKRTLAGLTQTQWVLGSGTSWTTTETDSLGEYACRYAKDEKSGAMTKSRRFNTAAQKGELRINMLESSFTATRGTFWLNSLRGTEKMAMVHEGKVVLRLESSILLTRRADSPALPASLAGLTMAEAKANFQEDALSVGIAITDPSLDKNRLARLREKHSHAPYDAVFGQLRDAFAKMNSHADTVAAMEAMREWLEVHPEEAYRVGATLRDASLPEGLTSRLIHALELAGRSVPQAQETLGEIMLDRSAYPEHAVLQAVVASGDVDELRGAKLFEGLKDIMANPLSTDKSDDFLFSDAALYSVGRLAEKNPEARSALIAALEPRLRDPQNNSSSDLVTALQSLANGRVAEPSLREASQALETHADAEVRAAVVDYLRRAYPEDKSLAMKALADSSDVVQASAVASLADPETATPETLQALRARLNQPNLPAQTRDAINNALEQQELLSGK